MDNPLIFIVGLTGVGKSTTIETLLQARPELSLLPNRRALTDTIIIPWVQAQDGPSREPISDRVTRFAYTRRYREAHPGGVVDALRTYLKTHPTSAATLVFDNVRGEAEVKAALEHFTSARFIVLDAPIMVRLERLLGRRDRFDGLAEKTNQAQDRELLSELDAIDGLEPSLNPTQLIDLQRATGAPTDTLLGATKIVLAEQKNYQADAALRHLQRALDPAQLCYIDTSKHPPVEVSAQIAGWL